MHLASRRLVAHLQQRHRMPLDDVAIIIGAVG
jgi:hypothetical protein